VPQSIDPFAFIGLALSPDIFSNAFWFAIDVLSFVNAAVREHLIAISLFVVALPVSFIYSIVVINNNTKPVTTAVNDLPVVRSLSIFFQFEVL
jgi:hypothetical protein